MLPKVLQLDPRDNVLVALANLGNGEFVSNAGESFRLSSDVPAKHKFVTHEIAAGGEIIMYGVLVGRASKAIHQGELLTDRKSTRLNSSHLVISYAVFCLKK